MPLFAATILAATLLVGTPAAEGPGGAVTTAAPASVLVSVPAAVRPTNGAAAARSVVSGTNATAAGASTNSGVAFDVSIHAPPDATEVAFREVMVQDDSAQEEIDRWIREADARPEAADAGALQKRIAERIEPVDRAYRMFLEKHPGHAAARVAFGSFLNDTGREGDAVEQWERALQLETNNPAIYNNLAGVYCHRGPITNALAYFEKAVELEPSEATYLRNFATAVLVYRKDVMGYYGYADEQKVFDKSLELYRRAVALEPRDFILASDLAQTYYLVKPARIEEALGAWRAAYALAGDDLERQGVRVHFARWLATAGKWTEARTNLDLVTDPNYRSIKERLIRNIEVKSATDLPPGSPTSVAPAVVSPGTPR